MLDALRSSLLFGVIADAGRINTGVLTHAQAIAILWPDVTYDPPDLGIEGNLYQAVRALRKLVGAERIITHEGVGFSLGFDPPRNGGGPLSVDLVDFRAHAKTGRPEDAAQALRLVEGAFLAEIPEARRYRGVADPRERIRDEYADAVIALTGWPLGNARTIVRDFVEAPTGTLLDIVTAADPDDLPDGTLDSRPAWSAFAAQQLAPGGSRSLRTTLTGPLFLHTDAYYRRLNEDPSGRHMESDLRDFIDRLGGKRTSDVRLMLRCTDRYYASVAAHVAPGDRDAFTEHVLLQIDAVWGSDGSRGPDLCCYNTGIGELCVVFDRAVVTSWRSHETREMGYPMIVNRRREVIENRRRRFDEQVDDNTEGQAREVEKLREFVLRIPERATNFSYMH